MIRTINYWFEALACFVLAICSCSCYELPSEVSVQKAFTLAIERQDTIKLLVCDYRQYYQIGKKPKYNYIRKYLRNSADLLYSDISLPKNRVAQYVYQFKSLPAIMTVTPVGGVASIEYESGVDTIMQIESDLMRMLFEGASELSMDEPCPEVFSHIESHESLKDNIFANYLLSKYYAGISDEKGVVYREHLIRTFEKAPYRIMESLYLEAMKESEDTLAHIALLPSVFLFPDIPTNSDTTVAVVIRNYGDRPFVMTDVRVSCSCLKTRYPRVVEGGNADTLYISFSSGMEKAEFEQDVVIGRALYGMKYVVSLKGNTI